jgi:hypothetical protein
MIGAMQRVAGLLILFVVLLGCGGPAASPSPATTGPRPSPLPAGTYQSNAFSPALSFTLPEGWWIAADSADYLALQPVASDQAGIFLFRDPQAASQNSACPIEPEPSVGSLSSDLSIWIRARPGLTVGTPRLVEVGGLHGSELDVAITQGWTGSCPFANGLPAVPLFVDPATELRWVVAGSERLRLSLLDVAGGGTLVVDIDAFDGSLMDTLINQATPIVNSFVFRS